MLIQFLKTFGIFSGIHNKFKNLQELNIKNEYIGYENVVKTKCYIALSNQKNIEYNSKTQIYEQINKNTDFEDSTKIILNDLENDKLTVLYNAIKNKLLEIYNEKKAIITSGIEI